MLVKANVALFTSGVVMLSSVSSANPCDPEAFETVNERIASEAIVSSDPDHVHQLRYTSESDVHGILQVTLDKYIGKLLAL